MSTEQRPSKHVIAAGAVIIRPGGDVLLVHRPRYDDWSFPKGKVDPGEQVPATAVREVAEETGLRIRLGQPLGTQHYPIKVGTKEVRYWRGHVIGPCAVEGYTCEDEIDQVAWVPLADARQRLTYSYDRDTLAEAVGQSARSHTLVVLRHAKATSRQQWAHDRPTHGDAERPLSARGEGQAQALVAMLQAWAPGRLVCSTSTRCRQSVAPWQEMATRLGDPVESEFTDAVAEEGASLKAVRRLVVEALAYHGNTLLCTHRPVLGAVLTTLGIPLPALAPGAALVVHHRKGEILASEVVPAP